MSTPLKAAIGKYRHTERILSGAIAAPVPIDFADVPMASRVFAPMVREGRYDISEMAIATFLMAKAWGKPMVLLPVTLAARFQEGALLCRSDGSVKGPHDLVGKRVGVRAYSQTTGMWLRGVLAEQHGVASDSVRWVTFEDAHVAEYTDPAFVTRAAKGADMLAMLKSGELDAAVFGNDVPADPALTTVFPDTTAAGQDFKARYGFVPVNHLVVVSHNLAETQPETVKGIVAMFRTALADTTLPVGRAALGQAIAQAVRFCTEQGLLPKPLTLDEVWSGLPAGIV